MESSKKYFLILFSVFAVFLFQNSFVFAVTTINFSFGRNLSEGVSGEDVVFLQKILNQDVSTQVAPSGPGSLGSETAFFGAKTKDAVKRFQEKYRNEILSPLGLLSGTGYVGLSSLKKLNELSGGVTNFSSTAPTTYTVTPPPQSTLLPEIFLEDFLEVKEGQTVTLKGKNFSPDSKVIFSGNFGKTTIVPTVVSENTLQFVFSIPYTKGIKDTMDELDGFDFFDDMFDSMQKTLGGSGEKIEVPISMTVESSGVSSFAKKTKVIFEK
ncbi:MAG: hypothetical protein QG585_266 [Patescibacteria group bacterium]|jgi:hypothetical protein|nr:hypothetical protein [Patescibacteria group bacterium]